MNYEDPLKLTKQQNENEILRKGNCLPIVLRNGSKIQRYHSSLRQKKTQQKDTSNAIWPDEVNDDVKSVRTTQPREENIIEAKYCPILNENRQIRRYHSKMKLNLMKQYQIRK